MRTDLLALTPEAVTALSNLGLVKRALKEIEQGKGPRLVETDDGAVIGTFDDGVTTRLAPGKLLKECPCTCPAAGMCRHRVAVALAYKPWIEASAGAASDGATPAPRPELEPWSPGDIDDAVIRALLGKRALEEAVAARRRGVVVEVLRSTPEQPIPTARLPSCTVRFLVPRELHYARCDCQIGQACSHVAVAVWAFREADRVDAARASVAVELRADEGAPSRRGSEDELGPMLALVHELADTGVASAREALAQRFLLAGERLAKAGYVWPATGLEDLAWMLDRYRARSSRYHAADALALATELAARARSALRDPSAAPIELPLRYVLGQGESMETKLDHLRLVSLGVRIDSDGRERTAEVLLADPDTGIVTVYARSWTSAEGETMPEGPELGRRRVAGVGTLAQLAAGQVVTRVARRRANRALAIGQSSAGSTSVTPQTGELSSLPPPIRVESLRELARRTVSLPPAMLRPRVLAESVHAVRVAGVDVVGFDPGAQRLVANVRDAEDAVLHVSSPFRGAAPQALDVLGHALAGGLGAVRWIAGPVHHDGSGFVIDPTLVVADRVIAPDVEERSERPPLATLRAHRPPRPESLERLEAARSILEEAFHLGLAGVPSSHDARVDQVSRQLEEIGAIGLARRMQAYRAARAAHRSEGASPASAFFDAAIRVALAGEAARAGALEAFAA